MTVVAAAAAAAAAAADDDDDARVRSNLQSDSLQHRGGHVRSMCQTVAEYIRGTPQPQISNPTCSGARRARVPAGSCVPERETPGAPGRSGVPAQSPDAVPATHTLQGAGSEPPSIGLPLRWEQTLHSTEPRQRIL